MIAIDLYTFNYEGESEVFLRERTSSGELVFEVHLFAADFSSIMDWIPFGPMSHPDSVVYNFNMNMNWGIDESECERLEEFYDQLKSISGINSLDVAVYDGVVSICLSAIKNSNKLFFTG